MRPKNTMLKLAILPVLAVALAVGACSQDATQSSLTAPEQADFAKGGIKKKDFRRVDVANAAPMHVTAEVGPKGATLRADQYFLLIPAGAVKEKTQFTMDVATDGLVSLTAVVDRGRGIKEDVGAIGFRKDLTLALYYGTSAQAQANASRLQVGWVRENGVILPVPSLVDERYNLVYGSLKHFSAYSLMTPHDEDY